MQISLNSPICMAVWNSLLFLILVIAVGKIQGFIKQTITNLLCSLTGTRVGLFIVNRLTFPGTIHHELSHALLAFVTGAKITDIHLLNFSGDSLGNVRFRTRGNKVLQSLQLCLSATAPVFCGMITLLFMWIHVNHKLYLTFSGALIVYYLEFSIFLHMTLSKSDISSARKGLPVFFLLLTVIFYVTGWNLLGLF